MSQLLQIGNITSGYRPIKSGSEYDNLFSKPDKRDRIIIEDGEVEQTVELMKKVVWKYLDDTKQIAKLLHANSPLESCKNTWDFLYHHIQYRLDEKGLEQLRRPARSWHERQSGIDCDCFSIFASSILTNLKIPHKFRITKYGQDVFQHVYVIVPHGSSTYIIDPVLSKANYEKTYTEKKDFTMNLDGINVAVLSGLPGDDHYDAVMATDLQGSELGDPNEQRDSESLLKYLIKTRNAIMQNPDMISFIEDPTDFVHMLDYAIRYWNTPNRDKALAILSQNENQFNQMHGLDDFDPNTDEELLGKLFKKKASAKPAAKSFFKNIKVNSTNIKKGLKTVAKGIIKYSPVTVAARTGFLLAMKFNLKKIASRLMWAYVPQADALKKGISQAQWGKAKNALAKVEILFADKLQGKRENLKKAIVNGKAAKKANLGDFQGLGEPVTATAAAAMIAAATPVIVATIKIMKQAGLIPPNESEQVNMNESEIKKLSSQNPSSADYSDFEPDSGNESPAPLKPGNPSINFIKKNPMIVVGGIAAIGGIGYLLFSGDKKPKGKSLSGTKNRANRKRTTNNPENVKTIKIN